MPPTRLRSGVTIRERELKEVDFIAAHWTIAGDAVPATDHDHSPFDFSDRVEQAARAGFKGLSLWHADYAHIRRTRSLAEIQHILADNGMKYVELSPLLDWFAPAGDLRSASDRRRQMFLEASDVLGLWNLRISDTGRTSRPMNQVIDEFGRLCEEASEHGTRVAYELVPFSSIRTLEAARQLVQGAAAHNGGVIFDLWHVAKLGIRYEDVWQFPREYFFGVEICDGYLTKPPTSDLMQETMHHRLWCGEGEFEVRRFLSYLPDSSYSGPVGVEVCNQESRSWPLEKLVTKAYSTAQAQLPR
jgi:sugar phosphate isomerase/epimerase